MKRGSQETETGGPDWEQRHLTEEDAVQHRYPGSQKQAFEALARSRGPNPVSQGEVARQEDHPGGQNIDSPTQVVEDVGFGIIQDAEGDGRAKDRQVLAFRSPEALDGAQHQTRQQQAEAGPNDAQAGRAEAFHEISERISVKLSVAEGLRQFDLSQGPR